MGQQLPLDESVCIGSSRTAGMKEIVPDVAYQRLAIVNIAYCGPSDRRPPHDPTSPDPATPGVASDPAPWVLIDAGVAGTASLIVEAAERRFGKDARPAAIVMTHGHFDHVGALPELAEKWDVPIYAHPLELPYLNGDASYPPPDPGVGGGLMSTLSRFYPRGPIDVSRWLQPLPADGTIPAMPLWRWIHTPGHTPGHVSLWRESDRTLIAGDAFITTDQESAYAVLVQRPELHGPPMYYTPDWQKAEQSVRHLATLEPERTITGHGPALQGPAMRAALHTLANNFRRLAVPEQGLYVGSPARVESGRAYLPPEGSGHR